MSKASQYTAGSAVFVLFILAFFILTVILAWGYPPSASLAPILVGVMGIAAMLFQLAIEVLENRRAGSTEEGGDTSSLAPRGPATLQRELLLGGYFLALVVGVLLIGFWIATPVFIATFLRLRERLGWLACLGSAVAAELVLYLIFWKLLQIELYSGLLFN